MTVKHLSVDYNKVNEQGTFSPGDTLSGRVTVVTSGGTKVQCFLVKAKGKAKVTWHEQEGHATRTHRDKRQYFYFEHIFIQDKNKGDGSEIIRSGRNVYPFTFVIPNTDMPSSYEGKWGKIKYSLQAQLTQSIWLVHKTKTEFPFLTKSEFPFASKSETIIIGLKEPQYATRISFSGSAKVVMNVTSEKMGVKQGEAMGVSVEVLNDSARTVTPTFYLCEKQTFAAQSKRIVHTNETLFGTGDPVAAETSRSTTKVLGILPQLQPTFFNCCMMKLEYRLKVLMRLYSAMHDDNSHRLHDGGRRGERGLTAPMALLHSDDGYMLNKESYYRPTCSVLFPCADNLLSENQSEAVAPHNDQGIKYRAVMHILFLWVQVRLDGPRDAEIKLPLVILLGSPKPHQQKPKRSIWFLNLPS